MSRTLFIISDDVFTGLGAPITDKMIAEVRSIFSFASNFRVRPTVTSDLPERIDFTDSVIRIVDEDADVSAAENVMQNQQLRSIAASVRRRNLNVETGRFTRH